MARIKASAKGFENWLRGQLGDELVEEDLQEKHDKMRDGPFPFLRATYWRWCETIGEICPEAGELPGILSVGDTHLENFGTWRDADGRLVWGVNDFDDAAVMPYALDLVRLAASALLAVRDPPAEMVCGALWTGYLKGLQEPVPVVLERDHRRLREAILLPEDERAKWWDKFLKKDQPQVKARFRAALSAAMPEAGLPVAAFPRTAGAGSLGKPRFVGRADWRGGPVVRECKAILPSVWPVFRGDGPKPIKAARIAAGRHRAPDPHYQVEDSLVIRRLSPSSRKIEAKDAGDILLSPEMLTLMGKEIAGCHAGDTARLAAVRSDADRRGSRWIEEMARNAAEAVERDHKDFK